MIRYTFVICLLSFLFSCKTGKEAIEQVDSPVDQGRPEKRMIIAEIGDTGTESDPISITSAHSDVPSTLEAPTHRSVPCLTMEPLVGTDAGTYAEQAALAQAVRQALGLQGVADARTSTVSYGEERPAVPGEDEAAYAKNRRVELVYVGN